MEERKSVIMTDESDISIIDGVTEKVHSYTVEYNCLQTEIRLEPSLFFKRSYYKRDRA